MCSTYEAIKLKINREMPKRTSLLMILQEKIFPIFKCLFSINSQFNEKLGKMGKVNEDL